MRSALLPAGLLLLSQTKVGRVSGQSPRVFDGEERLHFYPLSQSATLVCEGETHCTAGYSNKKQKGGRVNTERPFKDLSKHTLCQTVFTIFFF